MRLWCVIMCFALMAAPASAQSDDGLGGLTSGFNDDGTPRTLDQTEFEPEEGIISPPEDFQELELVDAPKARLRGLDTLNNTVDDFEIRVGQRLAFKRLEVELLACRYPQGDLSGEAYAFLRIRDLREAEPRFNGWMLSTSPALSALDHPRYDIWVLSCNTD